MGTANKDPHVLKVIVYNESRALYQQFNAKFKQLEIIQKALEDYLGTKRAAFPRFYFLADEELIQILSQTRNAQAVQPHLEKCFDAMKRVQFTQEKESKEILGMESPEKEYIPFTSSVFATGAVEFWLGRVEKMMCQSLYDLTRIALKCYPEDVTKRDEWLFHTGAQPILTIDMIMWT